MRTHGLVACQIPNTCTNLPKLYLSENIPRGSWLVYEIELIDFLEVKIDFFDTLDVDKNEQLNLEEVI